MNLKALFVTSSLILIFQSNGDACPLLPIKDAPLQGPQISIEQRQDKVALVLKGAIAKALMAHVNHPLVEIRHHLLRTQVKGFGLICQQRARVSGIHYRCEQEFDAQGMASSYVPFHPDLKTDSNLLRLTLRGPSLEKLFESMDASVNVNETDDGTLEVIKGSPHITCTKAIDTEQKISFTCEQLLSSGGYLRGNGTDPMIGAGTLPKTLQADE